MKDTTIISSSVVGQHLEKIADVSQVSYLMFNKQKITLAAKISIGRSTDCDVVVDNKLVSRHHAVIQKIRDAYFLRDDGSTNGTFLNGKRIPDDKYIRLNAGDKITIGTANLVMS
ncbi:MAG: FHA domain-containing protein [Treponema sp.]|nr:FHA domain-containing protein [Treponema sp.]